MPLPFSSLWLSAEHDRSQMASGRSFGGGRLKWIERDNYDDYEGIGIPQLSTNSDNQDSRREVYGGKEPTDRPSSSSSAANATSSVRGGLPGRDRGVNPLPDRDTQEDEDYEGNSNDGFCDIHVTEENGPGRRRSRQGRRRQHHNSNWSDTSMMSAGGSSMVSGGSTTETESISLSREFRAVLTAARTNNTHDQALEALLHDSSSNSSQRRNGSPLPNQRRNGSPLLPGIGEDEPLSTSSSATGPGPTGEHDSNHANGHMAIVPTSSPHQHDNHSASGAADALALVPTNDDSTGFGSDREAPNNSSSECERSIQGDGSNTRTPWKDANNNIERSPTRIILEKVKKDRTEAKAIAWQDAEIAKVENRFKRDDSVITAWEDEQKVKASIKMKRVERKLEEKRAKAYEKMQNEIAKAHRKAENRRAAAEARKSAAKAKISKTFEKIRSMGKLPRKFLFF